MSRERRDTEYRLKQRVVQSSRTPRRSRQTEAVDYSECERETDSESETITSEGTLEGDQTPFKEEDLEALGTPGTLGSHLTQVGHSIRG